MSYQSGTSYAGDMLSVDAYSLLAGEATSTLIDVRTQAEWAYVGVPDISTLGKAALFLEWQSFPSMRAGWAPCFNVSDGFEGPLDPWRHRGVVGGWKAVNLPWVQR